MLTRTLAALLALLTLASTARAQQDRYELGRRLRAAEAAWIEAGDDARKRALDPLRKAVNSFFSLRFGEAGRSLDEARFALASADPPAPAVAWCESLAARADGLLVDAARPDLSVKLTAFYPLKTPVPDGLTASLALQRGDKTLAEATAVPVSELPASLTLKDIPAGAGDCRLVVEFRAGGKVVGSRMPAVSRVADLDARLAKLKEAAEAAPKDAGPEGPTLKSLAALLRDLSAGRLQETEYPAARLFDEAEALAAGLAKKVAYYDGKRAGEFWLTLPAGGRQATVRLFVPEEAAKGDPIPLVIAMHGAGGSENMFFDAYGNGAVVAEAKKRGWLVVAPRDELFFGPPAADALIDALAARYPVDRKRVYLVGHSMGAARVVAAACKTPECFAAVAPLAGGGQVAASDALKDVPFFAACGTDDFLLNGARGLKRSLEKAGVKSVRYEESPGVEHMMIVPLVLPEVFRFFEKAARP